MTSWMKRRIHRSRARCQQALQANKKARPEKSKEETNEQAATKFPTSSHSTNDK
ncbi:MAG: hypothetical protein QOJ02_689 [Acidobacteriota bacterium]|jgi:hypothetical protein|nr:hypothetical protein [Acidobacteriota bacterium]